MTLPRTLRQEVPLIIVGRHGWGSEDLVARLNAYAEQKSSNVIWLQSVSDLQKRILLQQATTLVFPSLYEGFGLPVLEAFASGLPTITSNTTSLPEVAQDAAMLINPLDIDELSNAMLTMANGYKPAKDFCRSWIKPGSAIYVGELCKVNSRFIQETCISFQRQSNMSLACMATQL